jgi:hypothetical protein
VLQYANETKFYRVHLRISYEFGAQLRRIKVIKPDAEMEDGRPLFLLEGKAIARHREAILAYRQGLFASRQNLQKEPVS